MKTRQEKTPGSMSVLYSHNTRLEELLQEKVPELRREQRKAQRIARFCKRNTKFCAEIDAEFILLEHLVKNSDQNMDAAEELLVRMSDYLSSPVHEQRREALKQLLAMLNYAWVSTKNL